MKSLVYWSVAVPAFLLGTPALAIQDSLRYEPYGAEYMPTAPYDEGAYNWDDRVYSQQDAQSGVYDGTWTGNYVDDQGQVYQGEWNGTYIGEDGRVYRGNYRGTAVGEPRDGYDTSGGARMPYGNNGDRAPGAAYYDNDGYGQPAAPYAYDDRSYPRQDNGVGGAVIGGVAGGIAGNLIGGRGNRLAGTLIGGGLGAAAGYAIDRAEDGGRETYRGQGYDRDFDRPVVRQRPIVRRGPAYRPAQDYPGYDAPTAYGWQGGYAPAPYGQTSYYYAQPQAYGGGTTTVVVVPGQTISTTTTTVTEDYVDVPGPRYYRDKRMLRKGRRR